MISSKRSTARFVRALFWLYKASISPFIGSHCRYHPTCSEYACNMIEEFGIFKGAYLSLKRLSTCHPFSSNWKQ